MAFRGGFILVFSAGLAFPTTLWGQARGSGVDGARYRNKTSRAQALQHPPRLVTSNNAYKAPLGTYATQNRGVFSTRVDQLRMFRPDRGFDLFGQARRYTAPSPIKTMLERRNLLAPRSPLGKAASSQLGRQDYLPDATGAMAGDTALWTYSPEVKMSVPSATPPDNGAFQDQMQLRLTTQGNEYYDKAVAAFRRKDMITAAQNFDLVRVIESDEPRAHIGQMFTRFQTGNLLQSVVELLTALDKARTADQLRVDKNLLFEQADYQRSLDAITVWVQRAPTRAEPNLMLAYFAWLNNDLTTAREAIDAVESKLPKYWNPAPIQKFHDFLYQDHAGARNPK